VRGIAGTTTRASVNLSWRRRFIDPVGQAWTPFSYVRADGFWVKPDFEGYQNSELRNFLPESDETAARLIPAVGIDYRFPLIGASGSVTHVLEPMAQLIARPNETYIGRLPNEDAQSLIFDDTSLFMWDKFSGYDRVEGGVRGNVALQYTATAANGVSGNVLFGQSIHLAGVNSFKRGDLANVGLNSGLESARSDYVGRAQLSFSPNLTAFARGRFDEGTFETKRLEAGVTANFSTWVPLSASLVYANYSAQPELGFATAREGLLASGRWDINPNWHISAAAGIDLDRAKSLLKTGSESALKSLSFGVGYTDECTVFTVAYLRAPRSVALSAGEKEVSQTILFRLELKTLGDVSYNYQLAGPVSAGEGAAQ
jgi:LPS-assembly protein